MKKQQLWALALAAALLMSAAQGAETGAEPADNGREEGATTAVEVPAEAGEAAEEVTEEVTEENSDETAENSDELTDETTAEVADEGSDETAEEVSEEAAVEAVEVNRSGFDDVGNDSYCADAVAWAVRRGITAGTGEKTFSPDRICTVAEILTMLHRAEGSPAPAGAMPYSNIGAGDYFYRAAVWAAEQGMYHGNTFRGYEELCSRSKAAQYLWVLAKAPVAEGGWIFKDVSSSASYAPAVAWAARRGIAQGTGDGSTFEPDKTCTRGEIVTFLYRYYNR